MGGERNAQNVFQEDEMTDGDYVRCKYFSVGCLEKVRQMHNSMESRRET